MKHDESRIQRSCVTWFRYSYPEFRLNLCSIPNGYKTSSMQARIAVAEGLTAGAADLFLFVPSGGFHGLAIEMKTEYGRTSKSQDLWRDAVQSAGYKYVVCRSLDDFIDEVSSYIENQR